MGNELELSNILLGTVLTIVAALFVWFVKSTSTIRSEHAEAMAKVYNVISDRLGGVGEHIIREEEILKAMSERFHTLAGTLERQAAAHDETRELALANRQAAAILGMRMNTAEDGIKELQRRGQ